MFFFFFFLKADYQVCLLVKRKKDGTVSGRTNNAHRNSDIAMYSDTTKPFYIYNRCSHFLVKITEIKVLYCSGELVEKIVQ